jgi:hypothetical protein
VSAKLLLPPPSLLWPLMLLPLVWMSSCRLPSSVRALLLLCVLLLLLVALLLLLPPLLLLLLPLLPPLVVVLVVVVLLLVLVLSPPPPPPTLLLVLLLMLLLLLLLLVKGEILGSSCGMRPSAISPRFRKGMSKEETRSCLVLVTWHNKSSEKAQKWLKWPLARFS